MVCIAANSAPVPTRLAPNALPSTRQGCANTRVGARAGIRGVSAMSAIPAAKIPALEIGRPSSKIMDSYPLTLHGVYRYRPSGGKRGTSRPYAGGTMQDPECNLPRTPLLRRW
jgi:hypothetical protein